MLSQFYSLLLPVLCFCFYKIIIHFSFLYGFQLLSLFVELSPAISSLANCYYFIIIFSSLSFVHIFSTTLSLIFRFLVFFGSLVIRFVEVPTLSSFAPCPSTSCCQSIEAYYSSSTFQFPSTFILLFDLFHLLLILLIALFILVIWTSIFLISLLLIGTPITISCIFMLFSVPLRSSFVNDAFLLRFIFDSLSIPTQIISYIVLFFFATMLLSLLTFVIHLVNCPISIHNLELSYSSHLSTLI